MANLLVKIELVDGADVQAFEGFMLALLAQASATVARAEVLRGTPLPVPEEEDDEDLREQIVLVPSPGGGLPSLVETTKLRVQISPDLRIPVGRKQGSLCGLFLTRGVIRGSKALLAELRAHDPDAWQHALVGGPTKLYRSLADKLEATPCPLIRGRHGVYGFRSQEAVSAHGRRSTKSRSLMDEV